MQNRRLTSWEAKRSGPTITVSGLEDGTRVSISGIRRVYRAGEPDAGTGTFPVLADHRDGSVIVLD